MNDAEAPGTGEDEHVQAVQPLQRGLMIRIPPRSHRICTLCKADYTVPLSDSLTRCIPCQKCEKCSRCRKIKKRKCFRKKDRTDSIFMTCDVCREKAIVRNLQKRLQAESHGMCICIHLSWKHSVILLMFSLCQLKASFGVFGERIRFL